MGRIRIGVAGWDYPDWQGAVYPTNAGRSFDRLAHVSRYVDVIEINSTFYRPVAPRVAAAWVKRVAARKRFTFTAKPHRSWTHEVDAGLSESIRETQAGLRPLLEAELLGSLLIQFPQSFHFCRASTDHLERLLEQLEGWPVVIEVRHASWGAEAAELWFEEHAVGWCLVDQPRIGRSTLAPLPRVTARIAYMRMHGRNTADWFRSSAGRDARYDYLYSPEQLRELAVQAELMAATAEELFIIQNNHFRGKALANALQMRKLIEQAPPLAPEELVDAYPELESEVRVERSRLF